MVVGSNWLFVGRNHRVYRLLRSLLDIYIFIIAFVIAVLSKMVS